MNMYRQYIIALLGAMLTAVACTNDTATIEGFEADISTIEAAASGGEYDIAIRSAAEWTAIASSPWIMISPANGRGEVKCKVKVDSTLVNDARSSTIRFSASGEVLREAEFKILPECGYVRVAVIGPDGAQATTNALSALGYDMSKVFTLEGGFTAWSDANLPTEA